MFSDQIQATVTCGNKSDRIPISPNATHLTTQRVESQSSNNAIPWISNLRPQPRVPVDADSAGALLFLPLLPLRSYRFVADL